MRKPRDYDSELKALTERAKQIKARKVLQLGELVIATGADKFDAETLAGGLLAMIEAKDDARKEAWRIRGRAFFRGRSRNPTQTASTYAQSDQAGEGNAASH